MSIKGQITTAEPLEYDDFIRLLSGLHEDGNYLWELYCCISFCTACRISDVLLMTWRDVLERDVLYKMEQKTGKTRLTCTEKSLHSVKLKMCKKRGKYRKYSESDRITIVKDYLSGGLSKYALCKKYSIPSSSTLNS